MGLLKLENHCLVHCPVSYLLLDGNFNDIITITTVWIKPQSLFKKEICDEEKLKLTVIGRTLGNCELLIEVKIWKYKVLEHKVYHTVICKRLTYTVFEQWLIFHKYPHRECHHWLYVTLIVGAYIAELSESPYTLRPIFEKVRLRSGTINALVKARLSWH